MSRWARRKDTTHLPIADGLEGAGLVVFDVSGLGGLGFDILVYHPTQRRWLPMEIKSGKAIHHKSAATRLKPSQVRAIALAPIPVVETLAQALACFSEGAL